MSAVKSRREQYSDATRTALLDAARRRFAEHGFGGTSLEDVAADIQATRGAVYHHFANKSALFKAVFDQVETEMIAHVAEASARQGTPWESAQAAMLAFLDHGCDPVYGRLVWQEAPIALGWRAWRECEEKYSFGLIYEIIQSLIDSGDIPPLPLEPLARVTFHLMGTAGMALADAADEDKEQVKADYTRVLATMLTGMRTQAAR